MLGQIDFVMDTWCSKVSLQTRVTCFIARFKKANELGELLLHKLEKHCGLIALDT